MYSTKTRESQPACASRKRAAAYGSAAAIAAGAVLASLAVTRRSTTRRRPQAAGPARRHVETITINRPADELEVAWHQLADRPPVIDRQAVRFEDAGPGRGTRVLVELQDRTLVERIAPRAASRLGRGPARQVREWLRRLKNLLEAGEVPTTDGQPSGRRSALRRVFA